MANDDLKGLVALMGEEIKSLTLKVEDLQGQLAAHRKARFGSKSESLDQLAFDLQEDTEIAQAAQAQHDETGPAMMGRSPKRQPNVPTIARRCPIILSDRKKPCRRAIAAAIAAVRSSSSARM